MLEVMKTKQGLINFKRASRSFRSFKEYKNAQTFCTVILHAIEKSKTNKSVHHMLLFRN